MNDYKFIPIPHDLSILPKIGHSVTFGNHKNVIVEKFSDNYKIVSVKLEDGKKIEVPWFDLFYENDESNYSILTKEKINLISSTRDLESLLNMVFAFGVNFSPKYQREFCWDLKDKQSLIETIFENGLIGSFCFNHLPFKIDSFSYEIIDGKQRLNTICEFFLGKFEFNGFTFRNLSRCDKRHFLNFTVPFSKVENANEKDIMRIFYLLNKRGKSMDQSFLEEIKNKIK